MLMLPAANRQSKETLKVFQDNGGFTEFFPAEDHTGEQEKLLTEIPNLDAFGSDDGYWGRQIKTSLGNVLRLLSPVIILDEGHKAYSEMAQNTLYGLNPSLILELSATPSPASNVLVDIRGLELLREEMIKLDLHVSDSSDPDWHKTLLAVVEKRNFLEKKAKEYEANTNKHIRPICLIQVERTGKDQIGGGKIHSEEVKDHLIKIVGILPEEIAIKTSEKDELKEIDDIGGLMSKDCKIKYIITKQALQEGWDCPFAYVLAILTNPSSKNALTQLVGRILRQPEAKKTGIRELDESYVFTFQQRAFDLLQNIRDGFGQEGLGDLAGQIVSDSPELDSFVPQEKIYEVREKFKESVKNIILPVFAIQRDNQWKFVNYEMDIAANIFWEDFNLKSIFDLKFSDKDSSGIEVAVGLSEDRKELINPKEQRTIKTDGLELDPVFLARQILDLVPNPWLAFKLAEEVTNGLLKNHNKKTVANNFMFIINELRRIIEEEKDRLAKKYFLNLVHLENLRLLVIAKDFSGYRLPQKILVRSDQKPLGVFPLQKSLFDFVDGTDVDEDEKKVAYYLDGQTNLFFWYRNLSRTDYFIQGWQKHKIYPDFIFSKSLDSGKNIEKIFVVETKGSHLIGNKDTEYKKSLLDLCNNLAQEKNLEELYLINNQVPIAYKMVDLNEWENQFNEMFSDRS